MSPASDFAAWEPALLDLGTRLLRATRAVLLGALERGELEALARPVAQGAGDVTFGLDVPAEETTTAWLEERARLAPLSLLTEDAGWRHLGPGPHGRPVELPGPDHGGPRLVLDPIDGSRPLMHDLRSAWAALAFCGAGAGLPTQRDVAGGVLVELPTSLAGRARRLVSDGTRTRLDLLALGGQALRSTPLRVDAHDRPDHGYSSFFRYEPAWRPELARLEAAFFRRLVEREGADARTFYDDQYCSNAGQLVLLAQGRYRFVVDARAWLARRHGLPTSTSKPYDVAAAILCARAAGAVVTDVEGRELDFPLDTTTPVDFVGWANRATCARLAPHLRAALAELGG